MAKAAISSESRALLKLVRLLLGQCQHRSRTRLGNLNDCCRDGIFGRALAVMAAVVSAMVSAVEAAVVTAVSTVVRALVAAVVAAVMSTIGS